MNGKEATAFMILVFLFWVAIDDGSTRTRGWINGADTPTHTPLIVALSHWLDGKCKGEPS